MGERRPRPQRPAGFPRGYGIPRSPSGMKEWLWAAGRLEAARNYWLATTRTNGSPHVMPVWGLWLGGSIVFSTAPESVKARNLARDRRAVIHVSSGDSADEIVILEGDVERIELDEATADLYAAKYDYRPEPPGSAEEGWFRFRPRVAFAWAEDFPRSVTRFDLG